MPLGSCCSLDKSSMGLGEGRVGVAVRVGEGSSSQFSITVMLEGQNWTFLSVEVGNKGTCSNSLLGESPKVVLLGPHIFRVPLFRIGTN